MSYKVQGRITTITDIETRANGAKSLSYVLDTGIRTKKGDIIYNSFDIYKAADYADQVDKFVQYNKVGDMVEVEFNVSSREYNGKYYTNLSHWRADKINEMPAAESITAKDFAPDRESADLPF